MAAKILFVEDEVMILNSISYILEQHGHVVLRAETGRRALELARTGAVDLVLLDINLPDIDGFDLCERLRREPGAARVPVIMVSARGETDDVVRGFECAADDYITKPYQPRVLLARIQAVLRRGPPSGPSPAPRPLRLEFAGLNIDPDSHEVNGEDGPVALTKTEFAILLLLACHPRRVFTRDQIIDGAWGGDTSVTERVVDFQVSSLRRKLGAAAKFIETIRGIGYKFTP